MELRRRRDEHPNLTGRDTLTYFANLRGGVDWEYVEELAERLTSDLDVKVGDKVRIEYYRSAFVEIEKGDSGGDLGTEVSAAKVSAPEGQKPAGAIGVEMVRRAEVVFVDPYQKFISFRSPDRGLRKISLKDTPELQHYLKELKKGDIVRASETIRLGVGQCNTKATLLVALARAAGLEARTRCLRVGARLREHLVVQLEAGRGILRRQAGHFQQSLFAVDREAGLGDRRPGVGQARRRPSPRGR